jgi:hypothetical protein
MVLWVVVAASVLLVAIVSLSLYGASVLPHSAELPTHLGLGGYTNWRPRTAVLWTWPAISAVLYIILIDTAQNGQGGSSELSFGMTVVIGVMLVNQVLTLRAGLLRSGRRRTRDRGSKSGRR